MQIHLCEDCTHLAQGEDSTIVDQRAAVRVERWQTDHAGCDIVAMFDTDTGEGVVRSSGAACPCCGMFGNGVRYTFRVSSRPAIMVAEGTDPKYRWRQYFVITDERCVWVEMLPAMLCGWKFHRIGVQSSDDWRGCTRDQIVAYKLAHCAPIAMAPDLGCFRDRLLAVAEAGKLPERAP